MNHRIFHSFCLILLMVVWPSPMTSSQTLNPSTDDNFFSNSLHFTNKGIEFIYSKEHGGLERLTGMSASDLGCLKAKCHITSCDGCHRREINGKAEYSREAARSPSVCHRCHGELEKDNPDVHFGRGMKCMDCHTPREMHGDGIAYKTFMEPGVFDVRCERCHPSLSPSPSHTVHQGKLDCTPCHAAEYYTCLNCHIDTRIREKKDVQVMLKNMYFLINHEKKVTLGNMISYVYGSKTMMTFAPSFSHSVKKEGRTCGECHGTTIVRDIREKKFRLVRWEKGEMKNTEGVIPVVDPLQWKMVYLERKDTSWVPIKKPVEPLLNYSGYSSPLTPEQLQKLSLSRKEK